MSALTPSRSAWVPDIDVTFTGWFKASSPVTAWLSCVHPQTLGSRFVEQLVLVQALFPSQVALLMHMTGVAAAFDMRCCW